MALETHIDSLEGVDEALHQFYKPVDEKDASAGYDLDLSNANEKSRVAEFRNTSRKRGNELKQLQEQYARFEGVDLDLYKAGQEALSKLQSEEDQKAFKSGDIDSVVERQVNSRVDAMKNSYEQQLSALTKARDEYASRFDTLRTNHAKSKLESEISHALNASKVKVRAGAMADVLSRAHKVFKYDPENDRLVAKRGNEERFGPKGEPYNYNDFTNDLVKDANFLFEPAQGGGARGGGQGKARVNTVQYGDKKAMIDNLEDIASGKIKVVRD